MYNTSDTQRALDLVAQFRRMEECLSEPYVGWDTRRNVHITLDLETFAAIVCSLEELNS